MEDEEVVKSTEEETTNQLRWYQEPITEYLYFPNHKPDPVLQQKVLIKDYEDSKLVKISAKWVDVPTVFEPKPNR